MKDKATKLIEQLMSNPGLRRRLIEDTLEKIREDGALYTLECMVHYTKHSVDLDASAEKFNVNVRRVLGEL